MSNFSYILALSLFLKERRSDHSFEKSKKKRDRTLALFKRATKRAIAHSLFFKEQQKER